MHLLAISSFIKSFRSGTKEIFNNGATKQIKDALEKKGYKIDKNMIALDSAISTLGFHNVKLNLYQGVDATIKVHVIK